MLLLNPIFQNYESFKGKVKRLRLLSDFWMSMLDFTLQIWYFYHFYEEGFFQIEKTADMRF